MKTDRSSPVLARAAAGVLAGLLLLAGQPAAGQIGFTWRFGGKVENKEKKVSVALTLEVQEVRQRLEANRHELRVVQGPGGDRAFLRQEVAVLIDRTEQDLDQAIEGIGEPGLDALRAWVAEEVRRIRQDLAAAGRTAAAFPNLSTPRAVAAVASLRRLAVPRLAAAPPPGTIAAGDADPLLDRLGEVAGRIFFLAKNDDLEVKLWVGSAPAPKVTFRFWSAGRIKGSPPAPFIIRTNGNRDRVPRGLYEYQASLTKGQVTELVQSSGASEPLDLVKQSSFFCCWFDEGNERYCRHVANQKECRP